MSGKLNLGTNMNQMDCRFFNGEGKIPMEVQRWNLFFVKWKNTNLEQVWDTYQTYSLLVYIANSISKWIAQQLMMPFIVFIQIFTKLYKAREEFLPTVCSKYLVYNNGTTKYCLLVDLLLWIKILVDQFLFLYTAIPIS